MAVEVRTAKEELARGNYMYEEGSGTGPHGTNQVTLFKGFFFNPVVSIGGALLLWLFVIWSIVDSDPDDPNNALAKLSAGKTWVTATWTWLYIASQDGWVIFLIPLVYYYGDVKLGKAKDKPEFNDATYFAMIFSAGVAIGLIFYGASEPLWHYTDGTNRYNNNGYFTESEKLQWAMNLTLYHWGFQAWVVYALVAVTMGVLKYRKDMPLTFRATMAPLFGKATWGWMGDLLDVYTIATIVAGLCTSLGFGAKQIVTGMKRLGWMDSGMDDDQTAMASCWVIAVITLCATASVVCGLNVGIKTCSVTAFSLGNFLMCTVFFLDEPWYILNVIVQSIGFHFQNMIELSFYTDAFAQLKVGEGHTLDGKGANPAWMDWWTIFYWGWWISWAPFVGTFLARISRGRTIRNVLGYSLLVPLLYAFMWFGTFGSAGIRMHQQARFIEKAGKELHNNANYWKATDLGWRNPNAANCYNVPAELKCKGWAGAKPWRRLLEYGNGCPGYADKVDPTKNKYVTNTELTPVCLFSSSDSDGYWFDLMGRYHGLGPFLAAVSVITIALYFVTSSDSGSYVVDTIAANGQEAHVIQRVFWALTEGAVAIVLMGGGTADGMKALQNLSIIAGLPITVVLMMMCLSLWRVLASEAENANLRIWKMPLYGGIFEWVEYIGKRFKTERPDAQHVIYLVQGLFLPPLPLFKALRSMREGKEGLIGDVLLTVGCGLAFFFFVLLHALQPVEGGLHGLAWTAYVAFAVVVTYVRNLMRLRYGILGSGLEDFLITMFFYPQVIAQTVVQGEQPKPEFSDVDEDPPAGIKI
jgi:choline-glycine betaine transporter